MMGRNRKVVLFVFVLLSLLVAGGVVWQRDYLAARYHAWRLQSATPDLHAMYVRKLEALGLIGAEALLQLFQSDDATACDNAGAVLGKILQVWTPPDNRRDLVIQQMVLMAPKFSASGSAACLQVVAGLANEGGISPAITELVVKLAGSANASATPYLSQVVYQLLNEEERASDAMLGAARNLVLNGLRNNDPSVRLDAIRLAVHPALQMHEKLLPLVSGVSCDTSPAVRQLVLLALGEHEKLLSTDRLCQFLGDEDETVRSICERALRVRGMSPAQIKMARMLHHTDPAVRAELPMMVLETSEVDAEQWLERLSRDSSPAVRAASAKAMGPLKEERLQSLLQQLCERDEDATVRSIAHYYWKR